MVCLEHVLISIPEMIFQVKKTLNRVLKIDVSWHVIQILLVQPLTLSLKKENAIILRNQKKRLSDTSIDQSIAILESDGLLKRRNRISLWSG
jgi:hypothetical protein